MRFVKMLIVTVVIVGMTEGCGKKKPEEKRFDDWIDVRLNGSRYQVKMPSKPHYSMQYLEFPQGQADMHEYTSVDGDLIYFASYSAFPGIGDYPDSVLDFVIRNLMKTLEPSKAELYSDERSITPDGYPRRDLVYGIPDSTRVYHRFLLIGDDLVELGVMSNKDTSIIEEYLNSLKIGNGE